MDTLQKHWPKLALIAILGFGIFFRLAVLEEVPPGVAPEEAKIANDAVELSEERRLIVADPGERLYTQLLAASFQQQGVSVETMRFISAVFGIFTLLGVYMLTKEIFRFTAQDHRKKHYTFFAKETTAIFATGLMATNFWHISFSRTALEPVLLTLFVPFSIYFVLKYLRTEKIYNAVLGAFFAISSASVMAELFREGNILADYLAGARGIEVPIAFLFVLGVVFSVWTAAIDAEKRRYRTMTAHLVLFGAFFATLLPALLWGEAYQYASLAIGALPVIVVLASFGFLFFIRALFPHKEHREETWPYALGAVMVAVLVLSTAQFGNYLNDWPMQEETQEVFAHNAAVAGLYLNDLPEETEKYLIANKGSVEAEYPQSILLENAEETSLPINAHTTLFIQRTAQGPDENTFYVKENELPLVIGPPAVIIPLDATTEIKEQITASYPEGEVVEVNGLWVYEIK